MVLANVIPLNISVITFVLNGLLLVIGFLLIGPEFGIKTVYTSLLLPLFLGIFEILFPDFTSINSDPYAGYGVCYIFVVSMGLAILFKQNASSGGLDIVAKILNKYFHMELGKAMALPGMCVALSSALFYDKKIVVLSILGTYLNGLVLDQFDFWPEYEKEGLHCVGNNRSRYGTLLSTPLEAALRFIPALEAYYNTSENRKSLLLLTKMSTPN